MKYRKSIILLLVLMVLAFVSISQAEQCPVEAYGGIGAVLLKADHLSSYPMIITEFHLPAGKDGIETGDVILAVDGKYVKNFSVWKVAEMLHGEPGTEVTLTIGEFNKDGLLEETHEITVTRDLVWEIPFDNFSSSFLFTKDFFMSHFEEILKDLDKPEKDRRFSAYRRDPKYPRA